VGYVITFAGLQQASVSWPDVEATRHVVGEDGKLEGGVVDAEKSPSIPLGDMLSAALPRAWNREISRGYDFAESESEPEPKLADELPPAEATEALSVEAASLVEDPIQDANPTETIPQDTIEETIEPEPASEVPVKSEAESIRDYLAANPGIPNAKVVENLAADGVKVTSSQVSRERKKLASS
jgi:hypothetical protein